MASNEMTEDSDYDIPCIYTGELPKRCPICFDGHDGITYCANNDTNLMLICKSCYCYGNSNYHKILFGKELSTEELAEVSKFRIRSLTNNLKEMREERDIYRNRNNLFKLTDKELYDKLEDVQSQIKFRIMNSDQKPDYKVCTHRGCLNEASDSFPVCIEHTGCPCKSY